LVPCLLLEDSNNINPKIKSDVYCLKGRRACPPEDISDWSGYEDYCEILSDPERKPKEEEYLGRSIDFDPEHFDLEEVNSRLR